MSRPETPRELGPVQRVVVKLGSTTILSEAFPGLAAELARLRAEGTELIIVTSGAVAMGMHLLGQQERPVDVPRTQALAAIGQAHVVRRYQEALDAHGLWAAQILITHESLSDRGHFMNVRHTFLEALALGAVPVVNENDTVATEELRFGDNDRLAAAIGTVVEADLVILLSDIDALYDKDPREHDDARPLREVSVVNGHIRDMAGDAGSGVGTGGMASKVEAAKLASEAGIPLIVADGATERVLTRLLAGEPLGTCFLPNKKVGRRRHWIGFLSKVRGRVHVDEGAVRALVERGSSLLPIGVTGVSGSFVRGDTVEVVTGEGAVVARGLAGFDAADVARVAGLRSGEVARLLGLVAVDPVIHRNDLVLLGDDE